MKVVSLMALAVAVAMDATAVAAARGMMARRLRPRDFVVVGGLFGGAQALMPLLGWLLGERLGPYVRAWDHWIVFALLAGLGGRMIWDAVRARDGTEVVEGDPLRIGVLLALAIATSIDAFAVGITLPLLGAPLGTAVATIGVTTAVLSAAGLAAGRHVGARFGRGLDVLGGVVLILLGTRTLVEHLLAG